MSQLRLFVYPVPTTKTVLYQLVPSLCLVPPKLQRESYRSVFLGQAAVVRLGGGLSLANGNIGDFHFLHTFLCFCHISNEHILIIRKKGVGALFFKGSKRQSLASARRSVGQCGLSTGTPVLSSDCGGP